MQKKGGDPGIHNFSTLLTFEESESVYSKKSRPPAMAGTSPIVATITLVLHLSHPAGAKTICLTFQVSPRN